MSEKQCIKCGAILPLSDFYKHPAMRDGHLNKCIECTKRDSNENYRKRRDYYRAYERSRNVRQERKSAKLQYQRSWRRRHPNKYKAHTSVNNAIRDGKLERPARCEWCGAETALQAHHPDHDKPLDVIWLCMTCHRKADGTSVELEESWTN